MKRPTLRPLAVITGVLPVREWWLVAGAAGAQAAERVGVVLATASFALSGTRDAGVVAAGLASLFILRTFAGSVLRSVSLSRYLQATVAALLAESSEVVASANDDTGLALMEGLYAGEQIVSDALPRIFGDTLACLVLAVLVAWLEPFRFVLAGGVAILFGGLVAVGVRRFTVASAELQRLALAPALDDLTSAIYGRLEIVANGDTEGFERGLSVKLATWKKRMRGGHGASFLAGRAPVVGAAIVVGLFLVGEGGWTKAALADAAILASVTPAFAGLAKGALDLMKSLVRAAPLVACLDAARQQPNGGTTAPPLPATITSTALSFTYPRQTRPTLVDIDITWSPGTLLALAGQNGSGKSTFVRLLLGLHQPTSGSVRIGDVSLADIDRIALRRRVGYLAQRPFLPDRMTIAQAIHLLAPDATAPGIETTLTRLGLFSVLARRSASAPLDVKLGALSAGEKQRVAIARVLLRDAPLLFLDEPDANLDMEGVTIVKELLREEAKTRMVLVIAHSPLLLEAADRVVHFDDGRIRVG